MGLDRFMGTGSKKPEKKKTSKKKSSKKTNEKTPKVIEAVQKPLKKEIGVRAEQIKDSKDESEKLKLYEKHGVLEYWIVNPEAKYIMIYHLNNNKFDKPEYLKDDDIIKSKVLKDFTLKLSDIWK